VVEELIEFEAFANVSVSRIITTIGVLLVAFSFPCFAHAQHPKMIEVDRTYDGREVTFGVGETLELSLPENPTTGFHWDFAVKPEPVCTIVKSTFEPATGSPGKGGTRRWRFQAVHAGTAALELEYRRAWEKDKPASRTFRLTVHVR
jgi:predicted secreted protein